MQREPINYYKIGFWRLLLLVALVGVITQAIHESGYIVVLLAFGRGPVFTVNGLAEMDSTPLHPEKWAETIYNGNKVWLRLNSIITSKTEFNISDAAGPIASLACVIIGLWLAHRINKKTLKQVVLMLVLSTSLPMTYYYLSQLFANWGDEYT